MDDADAGADAGADAFHDDALSCAVMQGLNNHTLYRPISGRVRLRTFPCSALAVLTVYL
jgi:hypothetical protein